MLDQIRAFLNARPFQPFEIELRTGRLLNVYDPHEMAINREGKNLLAVAHDDAFMIVDPNQIVSVGFVRPPGWAANARKFLGMEKP